MQNLSETSRKLISNSKEVSIRKPDYSQSQCLDHAIALFTMESDRNTEFSALNALIELAAPRVFEE